jgi:hypothetical protein
VIPDWSRAEARDMLLITEVDDMSAAQAFVARVIAMGFAGPRVEAAFKAFANDIYAKKEKA